MNEELDDTTRGALVKYRLERAHETLKEAKLLSENGFFNASVNRLYYACFYSAQALLIEYKISTHTHAGVKASFGINFISTGVIPMNIGKTLSTLFEKRQSGDYEDFIVCDKEDADILTEKAIEFVNTIDKIVSAKSEPTTE